MRLPLAYYGDPILRRKCEPVLEITDEIRKLVADMIETMDANDGAGIAAPQVFHSLRIFVLRKYVELSPHKVTMSDPKVYINPKLSKPGEETDIHDEGCISFPKLRVPVERPYSIVIEATDLQGNLFREEEEGYNARVLMHENDHLNGVLHIDRTDPHSRKLIEKELQAIKKKYYLKKK